MFGIQRLQKIREIILEQGYVDVQVLKEKMGVSDITIRRDLDKLEKEGLIIKTYGGAVLNNDFSSRSPTFEGNNLNDYDEEGELISRIAANMIEGEEIIFLSGGTISRYIARRIKDRKKLMVITNDIFVAAELNSNPNIKVTVTGGDLVTDAGIMVGPYVLRMLKEICVNKAFIEVKGVHLKFGYSMESYDEVEIIKRIIDISNEVIALAAYDKFGTTSFTKLGDLNLFKKIVSNKEVPEEYKRYCYENCIKLYTTYELQ